MERTRDNCARTGIQLETVVANILQWAPEAPVDAILLDAPCSATGIFRRHPDVLHIVGPRQIAEQSAIQTAMLERVSDWLKPGGRLVYATCSLEPEEGEQQMSGFLSKHPDFAVLPIDATVLPDAVSLNFGGHLRILPGMLSEKGGLDGFFIALLEKSHSM
jgi:16S rRNA (cytosine967-C5)-methyltransferase